MLLKLAKWNTIRNLGSGNRTISILPALFGKGFSSPLLLRCFWQLRFPILADGHPFVSPEGRFYGQRVRRRKYRRTMT